MNTDSSIDLDEYEPPERQDFRRVGRWFLPHVMNVEGNKRITYRRSSSAGKVLDDESNLTDWKLRTAVVGAAQRPELMAMASTYDVDLNKKELRDIAEECLVAGKGQRRAITGTAIHSMFDRIDLNENWFPAPQFMGLCEEYKALKERWGLVPEFIEIHCVNDEWKLAGRMDRGYRTTKPLLAPDGMIISIGSVVGADFKTGRELEYASGSYATQLAAYVDSLRYDVNTDERFPFDPPLLKDWALIIHADQSGTRIDVYWVDLAAGRVGLALADQVRQWRRRDGLLILAPEPLRLIRDESASAMPSEVPSEPESEAAALPPVVAVDGRTTAARHEWLAGRVRAVLGASEIAAKALQRQWPTGVPGLKNGGHTSDQLDAIESAVGIVESQYSLPFYPMFHDPAIEAAKQSHPSSQPVQRQPSARESILSHPRLPLIKRWIALGMEGGVDTSIDTSELANALVHFASVEESEWSDDELTVMLDGSLRAIGYAKGCRDLGRFNPQDSRLLMTAAFAVAAGTATLLFDEEDNPVVRHNIDKGHSL